ncbi:hypothetical protein C3007_03945 [Avibacterium gallinarum]|uniref:Uncharacterized protein n=1 Tax=Avibacterium endocarditidis TaxID=380674 RepID=A0ABX4ZRJ7_9PAST|nr:hypothetical protein C3Z13_11065 [Avibacterium endocarditidis]POY44476.1 hypothetical protein C3007_03945 [Avibacterium gallinarum]
MFSHQSQLTPCSYLIDKINKNLVKSFWNDVFDNTSNSIIDMNAMFERTISAQLILMLFSEKFNARQAISTRKHCGNDKKNNIEKVIFFGVRSGGKSLRKLKTFI